ncbi:MAG: hypothetical protein CMF60_07185 [Magnetococcales bacterium]|nr:hypothetical protein [Magnetococcales bacterium]|tara:strand:+ start:5814 stop:6146 length:333 start_codon:yes stop_codon:yes gene_type:complete
MKKLITAVLATTFVFCASANADEIKINDRDAIILEKIFKQTVRPKSHFFTILYFDTGRICEKARRHEAGIHCSNWDSNPIQAKFFVEKCEAYAKDKRLCTYYQNAAPKLN